MAGEWDPFADPAAEELAAQKPKIKPQAPPAKKRNDEDEGARFVGAEDRWSKPGQTVAAPPLPESPSPSAGGYTSLLPEAKPGVGSAASVSNAPETTERPPLLFKQYEAPAETPGKPMWSEEMEVEIEEGKKKSLVMEIERLKVSKTKAVEEEDFEEAAALKRRIQVLETTLGERVKLSEARMKEREEDKRKKEEKKAAKEKKPSRGAMKPGESLRQEYWHDLKLCPEEKEFLTKTRQAMAYTAVTDDKQQGVPKWAFKECAEKGPTAILTNRPAELEYVFKGAIEDEKWEDGANFQTNVIVQVPVEVAFGFVVGADVSRAKTGQPPRTQIGPGAAISYNSAGTAQLSELLGSEVIENESVAFRIVVVKPKVAGKSKLEAAQTVRTKDPFQKRPFYSFKSVFRLRPYPSGGTHMTRVVFDFKQFDLLEFDALKAVSRAIEVENEEMRISWSSAVALQPGKQLAVSTEGQKAEAASGLAKRTMAQSDMYSAAFVVDGALDEVFATMLSNEILFEYHRFLEDDSYIQLDDSRALIRQSNGIVLLNTTRVREHMYMTMSAGHLAGRCMHDSRPVTTALQVMNDNFYRVTTEWSFSEQTAETTLIRRSMRDFKQTGHTELFRDLANVLTEEADMENHAIIETFRKIASRYGKVPPKGPTAISMRANYAMRCMPQLLDYAANGNVKEVREMLEVKGADPNYIHVRKDSWTISDSVLEFWEEITPLVVAAERGCTDVMKVLFNHPQLEPNLCCCAFNDMEIYNYFTAYDMTISKKHPHAAALLRAHSVLPASSEYVFKPPFDRVHCRPLRETVNNVYAEWDANSDEMPSWEMIAEGNPKLAKILQDVSETLSMTKSQTEENRIRIMKTLVTEWHPDRHFDTADKANATRVFQWLQGVKNWYMDAGGGVEGENMPLPQHENLPTPPTTAKQYLHPSGQVFTVW